MSTKRPLQIAATIVELSDEGYGVTTTMAASGEERQLIVRKALPGETVKAQVRKRRRGIWYADTLDVESASPDRVTAPCAAFERCAGCVLQHLEYTRQLAHKAEVVRRLVTEQGIEPLRVRAPVAGPRFNYRHKARLGVRVVDGEVLLGFREGFSNRIARMTTCQTLAAPLAEALPQLRSTIGLISIADQIPQVELAAGDRGTAYVIRHLAPLTETDLALLASFAAQPGRAVYLQPSGYDSIHPLAGEGPVLPLNYANPEFGLLFRFLPTEFTQVNPFINRLLVRSAVLALDPRPDDRALDFFSGIGNFSLALARQGTRVLGLESGAAAVQRATENARLNGLGHLAEFGAQDLYDASGTSPGGARLMLLDPPRSGAGPNLGQWVADPDLERIAYVSCNPETFAVDARVLAEAGFELLELGVFDMFPHTAHIETLGLFVRGR